MSNTRQRNPRYAQKKGPKCKICGCVPEVYWKGDKIKPGVMCVPCYHRYNGGLG